MARQVKCQWCTIKEQYSEDTFTCLTTTNDSGKTSKKYFHKNCFIEYEKKREFTLQESRDLDELVNVAGQIHNAPKPPNLSYQFPRTWYHMIQDFRNGTQRYTGKIKKRHKEGIPYKVITEAYRLSSDSIKWSQMDKQFTSMEQEVRYALAIVNNKIPDALRKLERDMQIEKKTKSIKEQQEEMLRHEREAEYRNTAEEDDDLTDLLGDW